MKKLLVLSALCIALPGIAAEKNKKRTLTRANATATATTTATANVPGFSAIVLETFGEERDPDMVNQERIVKALQYRNFIDYLKNRELFKDCPIIPEFDFIIDHKTECLERYIAPVIYVGSKPRQEESNPFSALLRKRAQEAEIATLIKIYKAAKKGTCELHPDYMAKLGNYIAENILTEEQANITFSNI